MGRALKPLLVVGLVVASIATGGAAAVATVLGVSTTAVAAALVAVAGLTVVSALTPQRSNLLPFDPKAVNSDPATPRKFLLGQGLLWSDVRYAEPYGTNQERIDYIFCLAAHRCHAVDELWLADKLAWTPGGGVTADFAGYLWVEVILEAGPSAFHTAGTSGTWGATERMTGCCTAKVTVKRSDNSKSSQSPFANGLTGMPIAWVGRGMPVYDPARDSTVPGGSGPQRADDCSTWAWEVGGIERGRNPALQQLAYRLGWRINGQRSVGMGTPANLLNIAQYAAAAAQCDEAVALVAGGSVRRFEGGFSATDSDDDSAVVQTLNVAMNGRQTEDFGLIGLRLAVNDLATPIIDLGPDDPIGPVRWNPAVALEERYTVVRGKYTSPAGPSPYGAADVPERAIPRPSLVPRPLVYDLKAVQSQQQADRIFKQVAQRSLVGGTVELVLGSRALMLREGDVFRLTLPQRSWSNKLFRVLSVRPDLRQVAVLAREESAAIYAWDREERPAVVPVAGQPFNQRFATSWLMAGIAPGADVTLDQDVVSRLDPATGRATGAFGSSGTGLTFAQLVASGEARDGDVVNFPTTLPGVPRVLFGPGGKGVAADNIRVEASGLSASGFTMIAKSQTVTAGSTVTDTGSSAGGTGEPDRVINRTSASAPFDGRFTFRFSLTVGAVGPGEPGLAQVGIFVRKAGNWTQVGEETFTATGTYDRTVTPGAVDFGTGAEFGVSLLFAEGTGTALSGFTHVRYTPGTVVEASLTPANASPIAWQAFL